MNVWEKSMDLVEIIYSLSSKFPNEERYGLTSQIRRAVVSIPFNIPEGTARKGEKEFLQFINISLDSLAELETQYLLVIRLGFVEDNIKVSELLIDVKKLLLGTRNYIRKK